MTRHLERAHGLVVTALDPGLRQVTFAYDPTRVAAGDLVALTSRLQAFLTLYFQAAAPSGPPGTAWELAEPGPGWRLGQAHFDQKCRLQLSTPLAEATPAPTPEATAPESFWAASAMNLGLVVACFVGMLGGLATSWADLESLSWACFAVAYLTGGWAGAQSAFASLREREVDVDLLMLLAAGGAALVGAPFEGAMLLFLFSLSNVLQDYALGRTRRAIRGLARLRPQQATIRHPEGWQRVGLAQVTVGQEMLVRPGEQVALDGEVIDGESHVDQSAITGESMPAHKVTGSMVFAGTQNQQGSLTVRVTKGAADSTVARMIHLVEEAQSRKARTQRFLEEAEKRYAVGVIALTIGLMIILPLAGVAWGESFYRALTVMVVASPCALVISTPAAILSALASAGRRGILFKGGIQLEKAARITMVVFDKTGTLTTGKPVFHGALAAADVSADEVLRLAASLEAHSEHPLAQAVTTAAREKGLALDRVDGFASTTGLGVEGMVAGRRLRVGRLSWIESFAEVRAEALRQATEATDKGETIVAVAAQGPGETARLIGLLRIADSLRPEAVEAVTVLGRQGVNAAMLTGDGERVATQIAKSTGITTFRADLLPEDKVRALVEYSRQGAVIAMVGDGTNDAPALATADLGIAMGGAGSDIALETADVVLLSNDLRRVRDVLSIGRATRRIVWQNLAFAGAVILLMATATLVLPLWGWHVPLPLGVLAHEGGTVLVCLNSLRLLHTPR